ncbi:MULTISPECIES: HpcH/HpaI aldolase family protein [unclassified Sphingobium]|uniref:HpcH/HpaI aldolase family protein n=1 Tax=unclassified Sphingobium TaxID=2611147 RepID=UPI002224327D|nr:MULTISPECIES: aldolase/citrate lyase family protein [unclassified Sphingobium]MCW2395259.1 2-dehydro-3-deoxyglucarate aldolase/4-hydroxy-2-oxoheptanedioate aldolase [Sphingobium sp. B8D3B]MCW2418773.1 2-dehydro-3-deoxyglucarate aldolase/4-hydroxy-2-oxoheptanedioate aldolase [Sphingobium sp. B8D3C]
MDNFVDYALERAAQGRGLLGTWVKLPSLETLELIGHAGFDVAVIDMEHAAHTLERAYTLIAAAQAMGMAALVRLPDHGGSPIQPLLDAGADGLLVPRITDPAHAHAVCRKMVFSPAGERGLGLTSRAGRWGLAPIPDYVARGDGQCLRMIQLEDWASLERTAEFAAVEHVGGIFIGHGDLFLSSGKSAAHPDVEALTAAMLAATKKAGLLSGVAVGTAQEAAPYLAMGFSLVMVSNDAMMFAHATAQTVQAVRGGLD